MSAVDGIDEFAAQLAGILKEKNAAYGDSFARVPTILAGMYKDVPPETLEGILFNARIQDKLGRIAKDPLAAGEDAYLDLAGYALLMANVQRLKREAKARTKDPTDDEAFCRATLIKMRAAGMPTSAMADDPRVRAYGEAPVKADEPVAVEAPEWIIKRGDLFLCTFDAGRPEWSPSEECAIRYLSRRAADLALAHHLPVTTKPKADVPRTGVMFVGDEAVEYAMPAEVPSEPNGRIKPDRLPDVKIQPFPTGWYLAYPPENTFFNACAGGFWTSDVRDATSFPTRRDASEYCRAQGELNATAAKPLLALYSGDWSSAVATGINDAWVIWWPAVGLYFQAPHMGRAAKWIASPNEATRFDSKDAANGLIESQKAGWASCE